VLDRVVLLKGKQAWTPGTVGRQFLEGVGRPVGVRVPSSVSF